MVLNDGISGVLRKINTALNTTLNAFEQVQRASGRAVDTAQIQAARAALVQANREVDEMAEGYRRAAEQEEILNKGLRNGTNAAGGLLGKVKGIVATLAAGAGIKALLGLSDKMTSTTARLNFLVDDGGSVEALEQKIMASAQRSRSAYLDTASAIASMGANAGSAFESNDELIAFMEQINKQFVIGGATAEGQSAAMLQLTQAMAAGALRGEELNSILENAPGIARAIESYMGIAEGSIKQYAEQGLITAEVVKNAMFAAADETNAKFESMPLTWAQIATKMQNTALAAFDPVLTRLNQVANSAQFNTVINGAINGLAMLATVATGVLDLLINGAAFVVDNWSWISPIVYGLVGAFIAYNAVALITNGINTAAAAIDAVRATRLAMTTVATGAQTTATFAQTAAQYGLNAALLACPLTWIIVLIIALAAAFMLLWDNCEGFRNFFIDSTKQNAEALFWFYNNAIVPVYNGWLRAQKSMIPGIASFCSSAVNLYYDMAVGIVGNVSKAVEALSGLAGVYNAMAGAMGQPLIDVGAIKGTLTEASSWLESQRESALSAIELHRQAIESAKPWEPLDMDKVRGALDKWGEEASAFRFSGVFDNLWQQVQDAVAGKSEEYLSQQWDELLQNTEDTAGSTAAMSDALDLAEEELAYLRDIAERDAINRFTTAEVRIDMTGMTNRIEGGADLDGVISTLTDGFTEALLTAAEGVHA